MMDTEKCVSKMPIKMEKKEMVKRSLLLLMMALLAGNHNIKAMGRAGKFVKEVVFSKTGIAVACAAGATFNYETILRNMEEALPAATVEWPVKQEVRTLCKKYGYVDATLVKGPGAAVMKTGENEVLVVVDDVLESALNGKDMPVMSADKDGLFTFQVTQESARKKIEEALLVQQKNEKNQFVGASVFPSAILIAKAARVAGRGKAAALALGASSYLTGVLGIFAASRNSFYRADQELATNERDARLVAQNAYVWSPAFGTVGELFSPVPSASKRVAALEEKWGKLNLDDSEIGFNAFQDLRKQVMELAQQLSELLPTDKEESDSSDSNEDRKSVV